MASHPNTKAVLFLFPILESRPLVVIGCSPPFCISADHLDTPSVTDGEHG